MKNVFIKTIMALIFVGVLANYSSAQQFLLQTPPKDKTQFGIRFLKPDFDADVDFTALSGVYDLYTNIPISKKINLVASLPYSAYADDEESESEIGNIYIGLQRHQKSGRNKSSAYSFGRTW